jgi:hypothetical protein
VIQPKQDVCDRRTVTRLQNWAPVGVAVVEGPRRGSEAIFQLKNCKCDLVAYALVVAFCIMRFLFTQVQRQSDDANVNLGLLVAEVSGDFFHLS